MSLLKNFDEFNENSENDIIILPNLKWKKILTDTKIIDVLLKLYKIHINDGTIKHRLRKCLIKLSCLSIDNFDFNSKHKFFYLNY